MEVNENLVVALVGVVGTLAGTAIGWWLTQITKKVDETKVISQKKNAVITEIKDLLPGLDHAISGIKRECEKYAKREVLKFSNRPAPVAFPIGELYFPEIVFALSETERRNLKTVYDFIYNVNTSIANLVYGDHSQYSWQEKFEIRWLVYLHTSILKTLIEEVVESFSSKIVLFENARIKSTQQEAEHFKAIQLQQN